jgi:arginine utilization protein RocB
MNGHPSMSEQKRPTIVLGIAMLPCVDANFSLSDGSNPLANAILKMCREVLGETVQRLVDATATLCAISDVDFEDMAHEDITALAKRILDKAPNGSALMEQDGTVTIGEAIDVRLSGKRTDH